MTQDRNERTAARDIISEVDLQKLCAQLVKIVKLFFGATWECAANSWK